MFAGHYSAHRKGGQTKFSNFFTMSQNFFGLRGGMADLVKG